MDVQLFQLYLLKRLSILHWIVFSSVSEISYHNCVSILDSLFGSSDLYVCLSANSTMSLLLYLCCCCSVTKLCPTLCNPMECSTPGFPALHYLQEFVQTHVHWVGEAILCFILCFIHFILCCPLLLLPSVFPSTRVFSNESAVCIRWPEYWSFSVSPSNEYSGLVSLAL